MNKKKIKKWIYQTGNKEKIKHMIFRSLKQQDILEEKFIAVLLQ